MYVPANHKDLAAVASGEKIPEVRSVIFCTEDAVADKELSFALFKLSVTLRTMPEEAARMRFVRVRNPAVMSQVLAMDGAEKLSGFVLPKLTRHNLDAYFSQLSATEYLIMPTLETAEVFDDREMRLLRRRFQDPAVRRRILALRIGGNDLLALLGIRRPREVTIYRTPLGPVISRLVTTFVPYGMPLTAPVFEHLDRPQVLDQEVGEDIAHGLVGKTAIHPIQVGLIERHYLVRSHELDMARSILDEDSPAVFKMHGSMCEVATHRDWARGIVERAQVFGTG